MIKFIPIAILGFLLIGLTAALSQHQLPAANLQSVCDNKRVSLKSISQVKQMILDLKRERPENCDPYISSFLDLEPILSVIQGGQVCNLEVTNMLRNYHLNHINGVEKKDFDQRIANPLRYFFISLAFQIDAECKITLINSLEYDTKETINEEDYKITDLMDQHGVGLLDKNAQIKDFDDILLLNDINEAVGLDNDTKDTKIMVKVKTNLMLKDLISICINKFKPYYEKLILPLVMLSNMGYNYQGELLARELKELKDNQLIRRWYNIVQTCESFKAIEIYEDSEIILDDLQAITLISKEEADTLKAKQVNKPDSLNRPIIYNPSPAHNSDELWIQDQEELERLVNRYKASFSESQRIKKKLMHKMFEKFKQSVKQGKIGIFASGIFQDLAKDKKEKKININEDMVNMMDNVISKTEKTITINMIDEPVAGARERYRSWRPNQNPPGYIPPKVVRIAQPVDESKTLSGKLFSKTIGRLLPKKMDLFMWFLGIIGTLLIITGCVMG